jgi:hypothetical protein
MKRIISILLLIALPLMSEEPSVPERAELQGEGAGFASRDATVLSMMGWGISLAVGFAALVALIDNDHAHQD